MFLLQSHYGDIDGKFIADLGSGCGTLSVGAAALDAGLVVGFELDTDALSIFNRNLEIQEFSNVDVVQCDVINNISEK